MKFAHQFDFSGKSAPIILCQLFALHAEHEHRLETSYLQNEDPCASVVRTTGVSVMSDHRFRSSRCSWCLCSARVSRQCARLCFGQTNGSHYGCL